MPRAHTWLVMAALWTSMTALGAVPPSPWDIRMRRVEGAAAEVRRAAEDVAEISKIISHSSQLSNLTSLKTRLVSLNRLVISARLAVTVSREESERH